MLSQRDKTAVGLLALAGAALGVVVLQGQGSGSSCSSCSQATACPDGFTGTIINGLLSCCNADGACWPPNQAAWPCCSQAAAGQNCRSSC